MRNIYLVFDQLPSIKDGGLIATYIAFTKLYREEYNIKIISVFDFLKNDIDEFKDIEIIKFSNTVLDIRFYKCFSYLKSGDIKSFIFSIYSMFYFFLYIPIARNKIKRVIGENDIVIAVAPAAAIFIHKSIKFILEIHIRFEYFWGKNILGRAQSLLMTKPVLTLFRNKSDANKGSQLFNSDYIYNFYDSEFPEPIYNINDRKNKILFVGRLNEQKDPIRLLECAELLKNKSSSFILDIYGDGPLRKMMESEIKKRQLNDVVSLKGYVDDKLIYKNYSMLWLTSKVEGFGLVIIEAKALKTPTISYEWGEAVYEVIDNEHDGYVVKNNEELVEKTLELFNDESKLLSLSEHAYTYYLNNFGKDVYKKRYDRILKKYFGKGEK